MELSALKALAQRAELTDLIDILGAGSTRLVGGAVRDTLLGLPVTDLDLATTLSPYEVMRRCGARAIRTVPTGIAHGTVTVLSRGSRIEVTTLRADVSTDGRRAEIAFTDNWRTDAERRDFTLNALYYDPASDQLSDFFGGLDDLHERRVRFIGAPLERIAEDHLRILRFFRFSARFAGTIDAAGLAACTERANDLMALSRERIADEWLKLLALPAPTATVQVMLDRSILRAVLPEIAKDGPKRLDRLIGAEAAAGIAPDPLRRFAALLPPDPALAERLAARLKLSNKARKRLATAANPDSGSSPRALAYAIGAETAIDRLLLAGEIEAVRSLAGWSVPQLPIGGGALIARGLEPGPAVARVLKRIEARWVERGFGQGEAFDEIVAEEVAKG